LPPSNRVVPRSRDWHTDNPVQSSIRADLSYTLFLSEISSYDGGEVVIEIADKKAEFKEAAGSAVFYVTGALHSVNSVTRGVRYAAVGWVQSLVRDPRDREVLGKIRDCLEALYELQGRGEIFKTLTAVEGELARRWVEPA